MKRFLKKLAGPFKKDQGIDFNIFSRRASLFAIKSGYTTAKSRHAQSQNNMSTTKPVMTVRRGFFETFRMEV